MQLVVGAGEVGRAVGSVLECDVVDVTDEPGSAAVLHVCFPWFDGFEAEVARYRALFDSEVVVVHSTVPVGTCRALGAVHSPVR